MTIGYRYLNFLQKQNFVSETMAINRPQEKISAQTSKALKQMITDTMFVQTKDIIN